MSDAMEVAIKELEKAIFSIATKRQEPSIFETPQGERASAEVLAAYATFKVQQATFSKLSEQIALHVEGLKAQSATIAELKQQSKWTRWLAISTTILAGATAVLAILTYVK